MLKLTLTLDNIDYDALIDRLLPVLMDRLAESDDPKLRMAAMLPQGMAKAALQSLPGDKKEEITALLLNRYKARLADFLIDLAAQNGLSFQIRDPMVERLPEEP